MAKQHLFDINSETYFSDALREEAIEAALASEPTINKCTEYENGWAFSYPELNNTIGLTPIVILKEDMRFVSWLEFIEEIGPGEELGIYQIGAEASRPQGLQISSEKD